MDTQHPTMLWDLALGTQPTSGELIYSEQPLWMRACNETTAFPSIARCLQLANEEGHDKPSYQALDIRTMRCPKGTASSKVDITSVFGRAPFEVQTVDAGWMLEHPQGIPLGYLHLEWAIHIPRQPSLDPIIGMELWLHEIVLRPALHGHQFGKRMLDYAVSNALTHMDTLLMTYPRLQHLEWSCVAHAQAISPQGRRMFTHLQDAMASKLASQHSHGLSLSM